MSQNIALFLVRLPYTKPDLVKIHMEKRLMLYYNIQYLSISISFITITFVLKGKQWSIKVSFPLAYNEWTNCEPVKLPIRGMRFKPWTGMFQIRFFGGLRFLFWGGQTFKGLFLSLPSSLPVSNGIQKKALPPSSPKTNGRELVKNILPAVQREPNFVSLKCSDAFFSLFLSKVSPSF